MNNNTRLGLIYMINFIDLFAGAGGLSEGFVSNGYNAVAHVEMNSEACNTLKTRACYYYLKNNDRINKYYDYLKGKIDREELYNSVPDTVTKSVLNETMSKKSLESLFTKIELLMSINNRNNLDAVNDQNSTIPTLLNAGRSG